MRFLHRLRRLETRVVANRPRPLPKAVQSLLPRLTHLDEPARRRVLVKELDRLTLARAFAGHMIPGVFTLELDPAQIDRAVQAMLDAVYVGCPSPCDVIPGGIEAEVCEMIDVWKRHYHDLRVRFGYHDTAATAALLVPTVGEPLRETALGRPFGIGHEGMALTSAW